MLRRVFTFASVLSLLACAAMVVLWMRSYHVGDVLSWVTPGDQYDWTVLVESGRGGIDMIATGKPVQWRDPHDPSRGRLVNGFEYDKQEPEYCVAPGASPNHTTRLAAIGFVYAEGEDAFLLPYRNGYIPFWHRAALTFALPAFWLLRRLTRRRRRVGHCAVCGYDLRASKERCPECGTPIPSNAGAQS